MSTAESMPLGVQNLTDDGLVRVARDYQRMIEDGHRDAAGAPKHIAQIRAQQLARFSLKMRYGAVDNHLGTSDYNRVFAHREPMTYGLAAAVDLWRCRAGLSHVLAWNASPFPERQACPTALELHESTGGGR